MTSKEQALKHLDELEEKLGDKIKELKGQVEVLTKGSDALEKRAMDLAKEVQVQTDRAERLLKERDRLQYNLNGYADLGKALAKIRGDALDSEGWTRIMEAVKKAVQEEMAKNVIPTLGAEGIQVTESVPYVDLKVSRPWVTLDESTLAGMVTVVALKDKLPKKFGFGDVVKVLELEYSWKVGGGSQRRRLQDALDELVGKYKVLERAATAPQNLYSLRPDVKSRVKESETREAVEAKE